ncbi:MAG: PQQ-binding-like beta-propeller repeat protein [Caldisericales bacterium]|nr:PQQ-binding-like beta-propeller repeat protein [Caldisericales bacterium]
MKRTMFLAIITIFLITALTTAIASENCDWNFFHGTAESQGYSSCGPGSAELMELWTYDANARVDSPAVISNGKVYFCDNASRSPNASLYCLDLSTGKEVWKARMNGYGSLFAPAVYGGKVFSGCWPGERPTEELFKGCKFYCFNAIDGKEIWKYNVGSPVFTSPVVSDSKVIFGSLFEDSYIHCLDTATGALRWKTKLSSYIFGCSPVCSNGKVYTGSLDGMIYCLSQDSGSVIWKKKYGTTERDFAASVAFKDGKIYFGNSNGQLYCVDANTGNEVWMAELDHMISSAPGISGNTLVIGTMDPEEQNIKEGSSDCNIYGIDTASGKIIWKKFADIGSVTNPAISNGVVYMTFGKGIAYALDLKTGATLWQSAQDSFTGSSFSISDNMVVFGEADGNIHCYAESIVDAHFIDFGEIGPNEKMDREVKIKNNQQLQQEFKIAITDGDWIKIEKTKISLNGRQEGKVKVSLIPEKMAQNGGYKGKITVSSSFSQASVDLMAYILPKTEEDPDSCVWENFGKTPTHSFTCHPKCAPTSNYLKGAWLTDLKSGVSNFLLLSDHSKLFIALANANHYGKLFCLKRLSGEKLWYESIELTNEGSASMEGMNVFFGSSGELSCMSAENGKQRWVFKTDASKDSSACIKPISRTGRVFFTAGDGNLYSVASETGGKIWSTPLGTSMPAYPAYDKGKLFAVSSSKIHCVESSTGLKIWESSLNGKPTNSPSISNDNVFIAISTISANSVFAPEQSFVNCFDKTTGKSIWSTKIEGKVYSNIVSDGEYVYFGCNDGFLYCLDVKKGARKWVFNSEGIISATPVLSGERLFFGNTTSRIFCVDKNSGSSIWTFKARAAVTSGVILVDGDLYAVDNNGIVYCLNNDENAIPTKLEIKNIAEIIELDQTIQLEGVVLDAKNNQMKGYPVIWSSEPEGIVEIDQKGVLKAVNTGKCKVTCRTEKLEASLDIEVVGRIPPECPDEIDFGMVEPGTGKTLELKVKNLSSNSIDIRINESDEWFECTLPSVHIQKGETYTLKIKTVPDKLPEGAWLTGKLTLDWGDNKKDIRVKVVGKGISFSRTEIDVGDIQVSQIQSRTIIVSNKTKSDVQMTISSSANWIKYSPESITIKSGKEEPVTVTIETWEFEGGKTYTGLIMFDWPLGNVEIPVKASALPDKTPPQIKISDTITVYNATEAEITGETEKGCSVIVDSVEAKLAGTQFSAKIKVVQAPSRKTIIIESTDKSGNKTVKEVLILNIKRRKITMTVGVSTMTVNGKSVAINPPPTIIRGATMVPVRAISDAFDATTEFNKDTNSVTITLGEKKVIIFIGSQTAIVDGETKTIKPPAIIYNGKTMVPFRFIAEALGAQVEWDPKTKTITLNLDKMP